MSTVRFDHLLRQQEEAQAIAARRARARSASKPARPARPDFVSRVFLSTGVVLAAGVIIAALAL